jgi:hypothetical protein
MDAMCEHKAHIGCALTAVSGCCFCSDKRPEATAYPTYIDGKGMRMIGKRWQRYCWKCRGESLRDGFRIFYRLPQQPTKYLHHSLRKYH